MEFLPTASRTRPRLALELRADEVLAARAGVTAETQLTSASRQMLPGALVRPGLRAGNIPDAAAVSAAVRSVLEGMAGRGKERSRYVSLVIPDSAARVLLLDFDEFPAKSAEALAVVRFRLKKLLPFEVEQSVVSYQVMSAARGAIRVLAVAMPCEVLAEYEGAVQAAGFLPGAVLPSTLAALAGIDDVTHPVMVVNLGPETVTTAIVHGEVVLLHRTVDLGGDPLPASRDSVPSLPLVDVESSAEEWAMQEALPEYAHLNVAAAQTGAPYVDADLAVAALNRGVPVTAAREIGQAISVAAAYFEDTLGTPPAVLWVCGSTGIERVREALAGTDLQQIALRELVEPAMLSPNVTTAGPGAVPLGRLAGVRGALHG